MAKQKLILKNGQSPGDILMLTAAVRDLKNNYPDLYDIDVRTPCSEIWDNNPYLTKLDEKDPEVKIIQCEYNIIHESNEGALHFINGFRIDLEQKLGIKIKQGKFWGDVHFSREELSWISMVHQHFTGADTPFWLICTGGKTDYTAKWWIADYAQQVVNHFADPKHKIQFVQFGAVGAGHSHLPLTGVINLLGKTDLRMLMRLAYHADGVICPVTFMMHMAAACPQKPGKPKRKACVVTAGGREPCNFTLYTNHQYLHTNGALRCCDNGGCWKSRITPLGDGDKKDNELCLDVVNHKGQKVQRCMRDCVTAQDAIRAVTKYYDGGCLKYLPADYKLIDCTYDQRPLRY